MDFEIQKKEVVKEFWDCGNPDHFHISKDTALKCAEKAEARKNRKPRSNWSLPALKRLEEKREAGSTIEALANEYGISRETIRRVLSRAKRTRIFQEIAEKYRKLE